MKDPLTDVLSTLRMKGTLYFRTDLRGRWGLDVPEHTQAVRFHVVVDGFCYVKVPHTGDTVRMQRGDLVLIPHGARHLLLQSPEAQAVHIQSVLEETAYDGSNDLRYGNGDEQTILVCGHFAFDDEALHPILHQLPSILPIRAREGHDFVWLDSATRSLGQETSQKTPGWEAVVNRVSEILFIQALRTQFGRSDAPPVVAAFADPRMNNALSAIHEDPSRGWSLEGLARRAGMSRTSFAIKFKELLGIAPMAYVSRWRLQYSRRLLLDTDHIVASIAEDCGYASEASFSRAFQRLYGKPPATYRREAAAL